MKELVVVVEEPTNGSYQDHYYHFEGNCAAHDREDGKLIITRQYDDDAANVPTAWKTIAVFNSGMWKHWRLYDKYNIEKQTGYLQHTKVSDKPTT